MKTTQTVLDVGDDMVIMKTTRRAAGAGTWATGTIAGHHFEGLVFPEHAECQDFELGASRISKLWLQELYDEKTVVNFDRGWDVRPRTKIAAAIVDFLVANLAERIYNT